jgi:peptidoglycan/xylan/chitin deacetylase (PgdA/CDA1 family)
MFDLAINTFFYLLGMVCPRQRVVVLNYHRIADGSQDFLLDEPDEEQFTRHIQWLKLFFDVSIIETALYRLKNEKLKRPIICFTFDDGYKNNLEVALPVLKKEDISACFFVTYSQKPNFMMWNDRIYCALKASTKKELHFNNYNCSLTYNNHSPLSTSKIATFIECVKYLEKSDREELLSNLSAALGTTNVPPKDLMMNDHDLKRLVESNIEIGAHATDHDVLTTLSDDAAREEIKSLRPMIEAAINRPIAYYAYPNGKYGKDFSDKHVDLLKEAGFKAAFTTNWGSIKASTDLHKLPRFLPWRKSKFGFLIIIFKSLYS